jgi:hypothetical protein
LNRWIGQKRDFFIIWSQVPAGQTKRQVFAAEQYTERLLQAESDSVSVDFKSTDKGGTSLTASVFLADRGRPDFTSSIMLKLLFFGGRRPRQRWYIFSA